MKDYALNNVGWLPNLTAVLHYYFVKGCIVDCDRR